MSARVAAKKTIPTSRDLIAYKTIKLKPQFEEVAKLISSTYGIGTVAARVLAARGYQPDASLKHYLNPTLKEGLPDPDQLKNLKQASELIAEIIEQKKSIAIACDFDVDGLSGGSQVYHFLKTIGVEVKVFVPDRFTEGYGLNQAMIDNIAQAGFGLLLTIDFGTTNLNELTRARERGLKTIVIDHHHVGDLVSPADCFINPQQKGCGFAGSVLSASGLAWYLLVGLKQRLKQLARSVEVRSYLDLACLGTICDMVPLVGANRVIARRGLELLGTTARPGLIALKNVLGLKSKVGCSDISFGIGPRLNAAGRMVHGEMVIELLSTQDSSVADEIAKRLHKLNVERQTIEQEVKDCAVKMIEQSGRLSAGLVVWDKKFHTGVIGIVAQRLVENFYRPSVVLGLDDHGVYKGSVRGIKGFSVVESLAAVKDHLIKFGGHEGAGGLSIKEEKLQSFAAAFEAECERRLKSLDTDPSVEADCEVSLREINQKLVDELKTFAPFGMGNPTPSLLIKNLKVCDLKILKEAHIKTLLSDGRCYITGLMWRQTSHPALKIGAKVDIACRPEYSTFNGLTELQANLQAVQASV